MIKSNLILNLKILWMIKQSTTINKNAIAGSRDFEVSLNSKFILFSLTSWSNYILLETLCETEFLLMIILYSGKAKFKIKMNNHSMGTLCLLDLKGPRPFDV
jgi:hypothetical protein